MMCEARMWRGRDEWVCGLLKGHDLEHSWVHVDDSAPNVEDESWKKSATTSPPTSTV